MKKFVIPILLIIVFVIIGLLFFQEDDKVQIEKIISQVFIAVERKDLGQSMKYVSLRYKDDRGFSYFTVKNILRRFYENTNEVIVDIDEKKFTIDNNRAVVDIKLSVVTVVSGSSQYIIGGSTEWDKLQITLEKKGLNWVIIHVGQIYLKSKPI